MLLCLMSIFLGLVTNTIVSGEVPIEKGDAWR